MTRTGNVEKKGWMTWLYGNDPEPVKKRRPLEGLSNHCGSISSLGIARKPKFSIFTFLWDLLFAVPTKPLPRKVEETITREAWHKVRIQNLLDDSERQNNELHVANRSLQRQKRELTEAKEKYAKAHAELAPANVQLRDFKTMATQKLKENEGTISDLTAKLKAEAATVQAVTDQNGKLATASHELRADNKSLQGRVTALEAELETARPLTAVVEQLRQTKNDLTQDLRRAQEQEEQILRENHRLVSENQGLSQRVQRLQSAAHSGSAGHAPEVDPRAAKFDELDRQYAEVNELQNQSAELFREYRTQMDGYAAEAGKLFTTIAEAQTRMQALEANRDAWENRAQELELTLQSQQQQHATLVPGFPADAEPSTEPSSVGHTPAKPRQGRQAPQTGPVDAGSPQLDQLRVQYADQPDDEPTFSPGGLSPGQLVITRVTDHLRAPSSEHTPTRRSLALDPNQLVPPPPGFGMPAGTDAQQPNLSTLPLPTTGHPASPESQPALTTAQSPAQPTQPGSGATNAGTRRLSGTPHPSAHSATVSTAVQSPVVQASVMQQHTQGNTARKLSSPGQPDVKNTLEPQDAEHKRSVDPSSTTLVKQEQSKDPKSAQSTQDTLPFSTKKKKKRWYQQ